MNDRYLQARWDDEREQRLARKLGLTEEEYQRYVESDFPDETDDGLIVGHVVNLRADTPPEIVRRLGGHSINIDALEEGDDS